MTVRHKMVEKQFVVCLKYSLFALNLWTFYSKRTVDKKKNMLQYASLEEAYCIFFCLALASNNLSECTSFDFFFFFFCTVCSNRCFVTQTNLTSNNLDSLQCVTVTCPDVSQLILIVCAEMLG